MRQAILLPYTTYQNAPSNPLPKLYDIPDDKEEREALLLELFKEFVYEYEPDETEIIYNHNSEGYGDMYICADDEVFLYVTFIK